MREINIPGSGPIVVCYGMGVDSTAMLIAMKDQGIRPDVITFADTGAEKPETLAYLGTINAWLESVDFPPVSVCRKTTTDRVDYSDLEGNCVDNETLPSLAFGMKSCSIKWKQDPQDYFLKGCKRGPNKCDPHPVFAAAVADGVKITKLIGYDNGPADLKRAAKFKKNMKPADLFDYHFPLQDLEWTRPECVAAIVAEGLPVPIKSACWFCPASKKWELYWLAGKHPDLFERALVLEYGALTGHHSRFDEIEFGDSWENMIRKADRFPSSSTTVGLGRSFAWNHWARVNNVVDDNGKVVMSSTEALARAELLKGNDNALDSRSCGMAPDPGTTFELDLESVA